MNLESMAHEIANIVQRCFGGQWEGTIKPSSLGGYTLRLAFGKNSISCILSATTWILDRQIDTEGLVQQRAIIYKLIANGYKVTAQLNFRRAEVDCATIYLWSITAMNDNVCIDYRNGNAYGVKIKVLGAKHYRRSGWFKTVDHAIENAKPLIGLCEIPEPYTFDHPSFSHAGKKTICHDRLSCVQVMGVAARRGAAFSLDAANPEHNDVWFIAWANGESGVGYQVAIQHDKWYPVGGRRNLYVDSIREDMELTGRDRQHIEVAINHWVRNNMEGV